MAMYHLRVKYVQRSKGASSVAGAAYRSGERLVDERTGRVSDYRKRTGVDHTEILLPEGNPPELADRSTLWNTMELGITRKNAQPAFEVEVALPRELPPEERLELVRNFAQREFVDKGLIVDLCIHMGKASDGGEHPHAHMLIPTRRVSANGEIEKSPAKDMQDNPAIEQRIYALRKAGKIDEALEAAKERKLEQWRERWAEDQNDFLERGEHEDRVDHRTLAAQQIEREATPNIGFAFHREIDGLKGWLSERVGALKAINWRNEMRDQFERVGQTRRDLQADFFAHAREYAPKLFPELQQELPERGIEHER